jgi:UDP-glucose 4-epimerase
VELIEEGYNVVILDNLRNSSTEAVRRMEKIVGKEIPFENVDLTNLDAVRGVFKKYPIDSVIHFAALKVRFPTSLQGIAINGRRWVRVLRSRWIIIASILAARLI